MLHHPVSKLQQKEDSKSEELHRTHLGTEEKEGSSATFK